MAKYECKICGYVFDEQQAGESFENLYSCPICDADRSGFKLIEEDEVKNEEEDGDDDFVFEEADEDIAEGEASKTEEAPASDSFELNTEEPYEETVSSENNSFETAEENSSGSFADFLKEKEKEKESELTSRNEFKDFIDEVLEENAQEEAKEESVSEESGVSEEKAEASEGGFVIEKRQEFWKKDDDVSGAEEEKKEEPAKTPFTLNRTGSVERVIGGDNYEPSRYSEESSTAAEEPERDNGLIQTIYSNANPVKSEEELKAEEEAKNNENQEFKPLWGNGMGTIQKVIGAESSVVDVMDKTDADSNEEMVFEEEIEENDTEELEKLDGASDTSEGTEEDFQTDPVSEEETYEEASKEEDTYEESFTDEETAEESFESAEEAAEDEAEEINLDEAEEIVLEESASEEENSNEEEAINEEENFFDAAESDEASEETVEAAEEVAEETPSEETAEETAEEIPSEETAEETLFEEASDETAEETAEDAVEEAAEETYVTSEDAAEETEEAPSEEIEEPASEEINEDEGTVIFAAAETPTEEVFEEASEENAEEALEETTEDTVEEASEEAPAEDIFEEASEEVPAEDTVEETIEETAEEAPAEENVEEAPAEEIFEEAAEENAEEVQSEEIAEEINEEAAEEENRGYICLDENEESDGKPVAYSMIKSDTKYTVLYDNEAQKIFDDYRLVEANVSNGLENIILLPAQCNPLPLKKNAFVETKTVIGALTSCPVEVLQPFCFSKLFIWGEHIPNNSKPESYNNQALVLVKGEEGHIPNLSSKEELREEVEIAKARFCGTPVGIDLVAGRIEDDLEACVYAKVDFVILNDVSQRILPYALRRARNYLNRVNSKLEILVCVEALKDAQELAKILALGANFVLVERGFDIEMANNMTEALKEICRSTGHNNVHDLNLNDICTIDTDLAMYTDISHV